MNVNNMTLCDIIKNIPSSIKVLKSYNINAYMNLRKTLNEILVIDDIAKYSDMIDELNDLSRDNKELMKFCDIPHQELIKYIITTFHIKHREQLNQALELAKRVETIHYDHPQCPIGLSECLEGIANDLYSHMEKEEQILFPMINQGIYPDGPIFVMEQEHDDHIQALSELMTLANYLEVHEDACQSWKKLYLLLDQFESDILTHIALENNILFKH
ncbi:iron-sulfur cluster repair di-iron protein [Vibrio navarrensis]|uniref:hemerythrin domain-containing protein n=1 Tax=Vibrio navarrensis TaxID=29495 RepID=UPI0018686C5B|nr:hemerythrin domain-containing protein [Vibrio navarrensis]EJK2115137.1 hemerythrin domain-containing protein [Vibrio navarrensis]MBE3665475.1 iron-sulfur cluster repair di-iron protein [Vibrio navarrensis]MBE4579104.1 iron-sulfur cluster repair di-iron protein [Vibrio navarrensis]MBE4588337.1 iron-sulfur cluster repair di-iron protein [Vibrio navarrensis]MBE4598476.1 iron-sulfur cluster repair di-iron protein [Vibrio navarrensis]